jgi:hypothetical protein
MAVPFFLELPLIEMRLWIQESIEIQNQMLAAKNKK